MENFVIFEIIPQDHVKITEDKTEIKNTFTAATVSTISVTGNPWVFFDTSSYRGDFAILEEGKNSFPENLKIIKSMRMIKDGIESSQVKFYSQPFYHGKEAVIENSPPQLQDKNLSLKVLSGAMIFYDEPQYKGEKRILVNGDKVQNYTAVKLTCIGKSVMTARDFKENK